MNSGKSVFRTKSFDLAQEEGLSFITQGLPLCRNVHRSPLLSLWAYAMEVADAKLRTLRQSLSLLEGGWVALGIDTRPSFSLALSIAQCACSSLLRARIQDEKTDFPQSASYNIVQICRGTCRQSQAMPVAAIAALVSCSPPFVAQCNCRTAHLRNVEASNNRIWNQGTKHESDE
jgi:hypothetical protein